MPARSARPACPGERADTASAGPSRTRPQGANATGAAGRLERVAAKRRRAQGAGFADPPPRPQAERRPRIVRRLRRARQPAGRSGVPTGLITAVATRGPGAQRTDRVTRRRGYYRSAASPRAGRAGAVAGGAVATGRSGLPRGSPEGMRRSKATEHRAGGSRRRDQTRLGAAGATCAASSYRDSLRA